jgi:small subunit ribosomal protein S9
MPADTKNRYTEAVGRRKTAVARVRITPNTKTTFKINDRDFNVYFPVKELQAIVEGPLKSAAVATDYTVTVVVKGGGIHAQAESAAMGLARALAKVTPDLRSPLKQAGHLTRDARAKERRKFGLKKARKAPQWSKR